MKKKIATAILIGIAIISSYYFDTTQSETEIVTKTKTETVEVIPEGYVDTTTDNFYNNYLDMRTVTDFETTETGLQIYTSDGPRYYWER